MVSYIHSLGNNLCIQLYKIKMRLTKIFNYWQYYAEPAFGKKMPFNQNPRP